MLCCRRSLLIQRVAGLNHSCTQCPVRHRLTCNDQRIRSNSRVRQLTNCAHGAHEPIQTPHVELDAYTDTQFFKIEAIIRPWRLSDVVHELTAAGILGMTQTSVLGAGVQGGTRERYKGTEHGLDNLIEKSKLDVVCFKTQVDTVVKIICDAARTGEIGDGKIFVSPVSEIIRIRTGETGHTAERMQGGMSDQGDASQALDQDDS